ncbi:carbohydrate ABC transporter permease [Salinicoccus sp. YB14-2]|uniref:carbohydrate ABC transporter permease n=1 Tax=Salinicoccus sp. YB14-2 TaxID=1572701 RepID=UPI000ABBD423|nr:sugar ABC transporter permease [Salinicoccus sp. YB14-2]
MGKKYTNYLLLAPALILLAIFTIGPLIYTIYLSFFDWNMISPTKTFVGFENYTELFQSETFRKIIFQTFQYIILFVLLNTVVTYIFAYIIAHLIDRWKPIYKAAIFTPSVISLVVGSMLFLWILNPVSGPVATVLGWVGLSIPNWTVTEGTVIVVLSLIVAWKVFGYNFIVLYSGIVGIPNEIIEAAKLDKISKFRIFTDIIIPMSSATGFYILIMTIVQGLQYVFTPIRVVTQGGPNYLSSNLIYHSYQEAFDLFNTGVSAASSVITLVIFVALLALQFLFVERNVYYEN